ncbi:MAG: Hydroxymethylpyrimidine/phosphomethylpyrimidine kinase [Verrucomicrobiae bacterium]|nr:Hydroxymethylpyrimidine/phosphomethylpyrimidine kinase [Verrucomicrobiae bacterium]
MKIPVALTVAGSDSGGGAGIQTDLKTFHALGVFGTSAITTITCQNPRRVSAIQAATPAIVAGQLDRILEAFPVRAAKTGMLYNAAIIRTVARYRLKNLVVDPVMVASSGARLLQPAAIAALQDRLLPQATVITPNLAEAELLAGQRIRTVADLHAVAELLARRLGTAVIVKGGHLAGVTRSVDVLFVGRRAHEFSAPHVPGIKTHGTGCTFSAAIAGNLALGYNLIAAVGRAKVFITRAIRDAIQIGRFHALKI